MEIRDAIIDVIEIMAIFYVCRIALDIHARKFRSSYTSSFSEPLQLGALIPHASSLEPRCEKRRTDSQLTR